MSLSASGTVLAIGYEIRDDYRCYYSRTGVVEIYEYSFLQQKWIARGSIISNKGSRTSLSADGNILVTGQYEGGIETGMSGAGVVYAFEYDFVTQNWKAMGEILNLIDDPKDASLWHFGYSVATSGNGQMIAIGHPGKGVSDYYTDSGYYDPLSKGRTHIYRYNGDSIWTKVGAEIEGTVDGEQLGKTVSLSEDGSVVAMASYYRIEVYEMNDQDKWSQLGMDIESGFRPVSMSLSTNGRYIAAERLVYKYSSSSNEWKILLEDSTLLSGSDRKVLSLVHDGEEVYFKHQGASASSYGPTTFGPTIATLNEEGSGIQTESYSIIVDTPSPTPFRAPAYTPLGKGKGSKSKGPKTKNSKSKSFKSEKSHSLKSHKQTKELKSHKHSSYSKKRDEKLAK